MRFLAPHMHLRCICHRLCRSLRRRRCMLSARLVLKRNWIMRVSLISVARCVSESQYDHNVVTINLLSFPILFSYRSSYCRILRITTHKFRSPSTHSFSIPTLALSSVVSTQQSTTPRFPKHFNTLHVYQIVYSSRRIQILLTLRKPVDSFLVQVLLLHQFVMRWVEIPSVVGNQTR